MQISDAMTEVKDRLSVKDAHNLATKAKAKRRTVHLTTELDCLQSPIFSVRSSGSSGYCYGCPCLQMYRGGRPQAL